MNLTHIYSPVIYIFYEFLRVKGLAYHQTRELSGSEEFLCEKLQL